MDEKDEINAKEIELMRRNAKALWIKLKSFKKLYKYTDIAGNLALIIALFFKQYFLAFLLFIMFFPDEVQIVRFFKGLPKRFHAFKDKET